MKDPYFETRKNGSDIDSVVYVDFTDFTFQHKPDKWVVRPGTQAELDWIGFPLDEAVLDVPNGIYHWAIDYACSTPPDTVPQASFNLSLDTDPSGESEFEPLIQDAIITSSNGQNFQRSGVIRVRKPVALVCIMLPTEESITSYSIRLMKVG
jgi:hypothetical protein